MNKKVDTNKCVCGHHKKEHGNLERDECDYLHCWCVAFLSRELQFKEKEK